MQHVRVSHNLIEPPSLTYRIKGGCCAAIPLRLRLWSEKVLFLRKLSSGRCDLARSVLTLSLSGSHPGDTSNGQPLRSPDSGPAPAPAQVIKPFLTETAILLLQQNGCCVTLCRWLEPRESTMDRSIFVGMFQ